MSILRKAMIAVLLSGAAIAAPSVTFASTTQPAAPELAAATATSSAHAAVAIRKVPCKSWIFNVYHGHGARTCYEGTGVTRPDINNVHEITTGENAGTFCVQNRHAIVCAAFLPHKTYIFRSPQAVRLTFLNITHA